MGLGSSDPGGSTGGQSNQGNNSSQNGGGGDRGGGTDRGDRGNRDDSEARARRAAKEAARLAKIEAKAALERERGYALTMTANARRSYSGRASLIQSQNRYRRRSAGGGSRRIQSSPLG